MDTTATNETAEANRPDSSAQSEIIRRHSVLVRLTHWVNATCFVFLLWSGVAILFAFPQFHIGHEGYVGLEPFLKLPITLDTHYQIWSRYMHFAFAWLFVLNGLCYLLYGSLSGHFFHDIMLKRNQLRISHLMIEVRKHLPFSGSVKEPEREYNLLQRISYLVVIFFLCPLMLLSGLTLAPAIVAACPWLTDMFYGRQTARLVHFLTAFSLVLFILVHIWQVFASGFRNQISSMITGRYRVSLRKEST